MEIFYISGIVVAIVVGTLSTILASSNPTNKTYLLPGVILTGVTLFVVIASFLIGSDGWSNIGYGILFIFVVIASLLGTVAGKILGGKTDYRDSSL